MFMVNIVAIIVESKKAPFRMRNNTEKHAKIRIFKQQFQRREYLPFQNNTILKVENPRWTIKAIVAWDQI